MLGGIKEKDWIVIREALARYPQIEEMVLFGSRAKGNYGPGSDIDMALKGDQLTAILTRLSSYLNEESPLPYHFDLLDYATVDQPLREHIDRVGIIAYSQADHRD